MVFDNYSRVTIKYSPFQNWKREYLSKIISTVWWYLRGMPPGFASNRTTCCQNLVTVVIPEVQMPSSLFYKTCYSMGRYLVALPKNKVSKTKQCLIFRHAVSTFSSNLTPSWKFSYRLRNCLYLYCLVDNIIPSRS